jgi:hypothetical protein
MEAFYKIISFFVGILVVIGGGICVIVGTVSLIGSTDFQAGSISLIISLLGLVLVGFGVRVMAFGLRFDHNKADNIQQPSLTNSEPVNNSAQPPSRKNLKWPENYQERIETIVAASYDETNFIYFLDFEFKTIRQAKDCITKIRLMQKQLRQVKSEINNKIKVVKAQRLPRTSRKSGNLLVLASLISDVSSGHKIADYQNVILNIETLLDACDKRKIEIEVWVEQQNPIRTIDSFQRERIPEDIQIFVWNRDGGKCVKCGSQESLEFDHIIPVSVGGSNTARNIQLLCERCNRKKGNNIGN